jgi:hypothetical protein
MNLADFSTADLWKEINRRHEAEFKKQRTEMQNVEKNVPTLGAADGAIAPTPAKPADAKTAAAKPAAAKKKRIRPSRAKPKPAAAPPAAPPSA